ncbi:DUF6671 family protein [Fulvivirga sedimenti]|uniref:DUF6671 domain-containing protein n=1 Tax=Fulvivirga sedimenti TaxID=2879465 RepID=A0A9X1HNU1_9BACT|nr:DUF6671 family protein [Fulvivirga sedimenti]MCA6075041.1 hypothetical protein [Fulvivirga sedimenti]MCA6076218.1 hypothetical protein [Fulvivirga sedimenti]MCA6077346.1 hypothetical protein [Fulvivirga sedimenti]
MDFFKGRRLVIATKHQKEIIIGPKAASRLGVLPFVPEDFDTDVLGTFSGEVPRESDPLSTARRKCELAMELTGCDLAIASEGSFGAHPAYVFIPGNEEIVMLKDLKNDLEIVGKKLSTDTNFGGEVCRNQEELEAFAIKSGFPDHALIIRNAQDSAETIFTGINSWDNLRSKFQNIMGRYGDAFIETDMRAMYNPKRMKVIGEATDNLLELALTSCSECETPGYGITDVVKGLPCDLCGAPTQSIKSYIYSCKKCGHREIRPNPHKSVESPQYCDFCNP